MENTGIDPVTSRSTAEGVEGKCQFAPREFASRVALVLCWQRSIDNEDKKSHGRKFGNIINKKTEEVQYLRNLLRFHTDTSGDQLLLAAAAAYEVELQNQELMTTEAQEPPEDPVLQVQNAGATVETPMSQMSQPVPNDENDGGRSAAEETPRNELVPSVPMARRATKSSRLTFTALSVGE